MLALFEQLAIYKQSTEEIARREAKPHVSIEGIVARIDHEVDEIRNGNVESGVHVADITGLVAHFPEFYRVMCLKITRQLYHCDRDRKIAVDETCPEDPVG